MQCWGSYFFVLEIKLHFELPFKIISIKLLFLFGRVNISFEFKKSNLFTMIKLNNMCLCIPSEDFYHYFQNDLLVINIEM